MELQPDGANVLTSLWTEVKSQEGDKLIVTLEHDHPDLQPQPGWHVVCRLGRYEIKFVQGSELRLLKN